MAAYSSAKAIASLWYRLSDAVRFYEDQATRCSDAITSTYLLYLSEKKRSQLAVFEKVVDRRIEGVTLPPANTSNCRSTYHKYSVALCTRRLVNVYDFALNCAENDLELFRSYQTLALDKAFYNAVSLLIELERDFFFEIQIGYIEFQSKQIEQETSNTTADLLETAAAPVASRREKKSAMMADTFLLR